MGMLQEFKEFAMRGNVVDMAAGIIIGSAFGKIVSSLVADVFMPPIGWALGNVDFSNLFLVLKQGGKEPGPYTKIAQAHAAGAETLNYGLFINSLISFLIVAIAVFILVRAVQRAQRQLDKETEPPPPDSKDCPYCFSSINIKAARCANSRCPVCRARCSRRPCAIDARRRAWISSASMDG